MLRLTATDEADLAVISVQMQDALLRREDLRFDKQRHRFALVANRFAWDALPEKQRRRAGLHFDDVEKVETVGLSSLPADAILSLLAISFAKANELAGDVILTFSAGIRIKLHVACINATLADLGGTWNTQHAPTHET
jgi:Protein of unknown function (DUF2948)